MNNKNIYTTPELVKHGKLEDQTKAGGITGSDGIGNSCS